MEKIKVAPQYSEEFLEIERPSPLSDKKIEQLQSDVLNGKIKKDISDIIYKSFKAECEDWIISSQYNTLSGLQTFSRKDIIIGCTQFIDNLYMNGQVQTLVGDYKYHERLTLSKIVSADNLIENIPLVIAMPFPRFGQKHHQMDSILQEAANKNIDVHIDGAWITCCRDINFDFNHPSIKSVGISLSKGLGLGWNRIGIRYTKETKMDSITIMNDFNMNNRALVMIGLYYLKNLPIDYLWKKHGDNYLKICKDFNLEPTKAIHLALKNKQPVGISPLLRYLENNE